MKNALMLLVLLPGSCGFILAQPLTQVLKGRVVDSQSNGPLMGVAVTVLNGTSQPGTSQPGTSLPGTSLPGTSLPGISLPGTLTDANGQYYLPGIPVGRYEIRFSRVGYGEQVSAGVVLTGGRETVLNVDLREAITTLGEVEVRATANRPAGGQSIGVVSSRSFDADETRRFAGSRNDPSRMAANYAGVVGANDARNDIVIRGNSPVGLLWRLEGVDIPNPNHFASMGSTGGPVSMINNNVLDKSLFLTGAFPAQYGNAVSGVFDVQLRAGNADKREYVGQIGFSGFEVGAEGPVRKGHPASYLINYRYSTPALLQGLGLSFGTGAAVPYYQDASMKLDFPTRKAGHFTVFGLGGSSHIDFRGSAQDTANFYSDPYTNLFSATRTGVIGGSHTYFWNRSTYTRLIVAGSGMQTGVIQDSLTEIRRAIPQFRDHSWQTKLTAHLMVNRKLNARTTLMVGGIANQVAAHLVDSVLVTGRFETIRDFAGQTQFYQLYASVQHRFTDKLTLNAGYYAQTLTLNRHLSAEPRIALRYAINGTHAFTLGLGRHSQMQPLSVYFNRNAATADPAETNRNLDFTYSNQAVIGYERRLAARWKLKVEGYYQAISRAPVERVASSYSLLNTGASFSPTSRSNLVNAGAGRNYGLEATLERTYTNGYYFLGTLSLFDSRYRGSDNVWRPTAFANNYVVNALTGREVRVGKKNTLTVDLRLTWIGGKPYTPIDADASRRQHTEVDQLDRAYSARATPYFRTDLRVTFRRNARRLMQEWYVDGQNLFNTKNVYAFRYDNRHDRLLTVNQLGFYPTMNWRIHF